MPAVKKEGKTGAKEDELQKIKSMYSSDEEEAGEEEEVDGRDEMEDQEIDDEELKQALKEFDATEMGNPNNDKISYNELDAILSSHIEQMDIGAKVKQGQEKKEIKKKAQL